MTLIEALSQISDEDHFDELMTVYAKTQWCAMSDALIVPQPEDGSTAPIDGHDYFLEVAIIKEWLDASNSSTVSEDTCNRLIQYAINDA